MKKRVLITVNPAVIKGREFTSMRRFVNLLGQHFDLLVLPISGYDFRRRRVRAYRRVKGGRFESVGPIKPEGDLWIVYSDGYYLDHRRFGFRLRRDYFDAQVDFHQGCLMRGDVRLMVNSPEAESRTLKSWFAKLDFRRTKVIPTYVFAGIDEVYDFQKARRRVVAKPVWGGDGAGVRLLADEGAVRQFHRDLKRFSDRDLSDYCFQVFYEGDEKRLWFAGGRFVAGRKFRGRETPWSSEAEDCRLTVYDRRSRNGFDADLAAATQLCRLAGIGIGAVDFIGDRINEINGAGTVMTTLRIGRGLLVDTRPAFLDYLLDLTKSL